LAETIELQAAGRTRVIREIREVRKLEQVNEAFAEVESGKAKVRFVFDLR
jgi:alcohol dehydrogenase, propanol-preferring